MEAALSAYKELAIALPRSAQARMQVAALELQLKQEVAAEHSLKDVLAIAPDFPAAQLALAELYVRKGHHELALVSARRIQRFHPDASAGFQLEGDIQMARQQAAPALEAYRRAFALTPNAELTIKISHALRQTGKPDQAAARLAQWLSAHPDDVRVQLHRADVLMREQRHAQAAAQLEAILARHPGQAVALNNLALAYQRMNDPRARPIAEKAYALAAGQAGVMDTLGWILVEQGELARGLSLLRDAHAKAPRAPDIRYHLAVAMSRSSDGDGARKLLQALLAEKGRFADAENARRLLGQLQ
jgi:putative PEP-CTERM system TPR-repeat lipoprotein